MTTQNTNQTTEKQGKHNHRELNYTTWRSYPISGKHPVKVWKKPARHEATHLKFCDESQIGVAEGQFESMMQMPLRNEPE